MFNFRFYFLIFKFFVFHLGDYLFKEIERRFRNSFLHVLKQLALFLTTNNAGSGKHERGSDFVVAVFADFFPEGNFMSLFFIIEAFDGNLI